MKKENQEVVARGTPYKDFFETMKEKDKWKKEHPVLAIPENIKDFFVYTILGRISDGKVKLKMAWQRAIRGFDDSMVWNHHSFHSEYTSKMLRMLAKDKVGCPWGLYDSKTKDDECHKWREILKKMAEGFEAATLIDNMSWFTEDKNGNYNKRESDKKRKVLKKKFDIGMKLYHEYYFNLWD